MDRASDYESEGQRFDSSRAHQKTKGLRAMMTRNPLLLLSAEYQRTVETALIAHVVERGYHAKTRSQASVGSTVPECSFEQSKRRAQRSIR
jgi:hypothetical protein